MAELAGTRVRADVAIVHDWANWWALELDAHPGVARPAGDPPRPLRAAVRRARDGRRGAADGRPVRLQARRRAEPVPDAGERRRAPDRATCEAGGHLVVSFFSGIVDECDRAHLGGYPAPLRTVLGLRVDEFWPLPPDGDVSPRGRTDGRRSDGTGTVWSDWIEPEGAETVLSFADRANWPAAPPSPGTNTAPASPGTSAPARTRPTMRALFDRVRAAAGVAPVLPGPARRCAGRTPGRPRRLVPVPDESRRARGARHLE